MTELLTPKNVYGLQQELRDAAQRRSNVADRLDSEYRNAARGGAFVGTSDWLNHPDYLAACAAEDTFKEAVSAVQAALGGVVYRVPAQNLPALTEKLVKLQKRAAKIDATPVDWYDQDVEVVEHDDGTADIFHYVTLNADPVKIAGWLFLAKLTIESGGVLVSKIPGAAYAWQLHREGLGEAPRSWQRTDEVTVAAQAALDAINLGTFCDEDTAAGCDHCKLDRQRKTTYLVQEVATGAIKQVGSTCLRDFLGTDPAAILSYAEWLREVEEFGASGGGGGGTAREIATLGYLTHVCTMLRVNGWAPRSGSDYPTADQASQNLWAASQEKRDKYGKQLWVDVEDADRVRAQTARDWALEHFGAVEPYDLSDFDRNCLVAARGATVNRRTEGILAYLPVAHSRFLEKQVELQNDRAKAADSVHFGQVGDRVVLELKVERVFETETQWGCTYITQLADADGNRFKWFGSYGLEIGDTYVGRWTVKGHDEYKGVKETVLSRPAKLELKQEVAA